MNLGKYIYLLLPEHDTVIVPGLGAFVSTYKSAQVDEQSGEMVPPTKEIYFEPKIKNNDGLLAGKIAEEENIPFTEANKKLNYEREEILYRLDKGETVTLENLGDLFNDPKGEIQFTSSGKNYMLLDAYGLEPTSLKNEPQDTPPEEKIPEETGVGPKATDPLEEKAPVAYSGTSLNDPSVPPTKRRKSWWLLLLLIPLLAAAIYIITKDTQVQTPADDVIVEEQPSQVYTPPADTTAVDTTSAAEDEFAISSYEIDDSTGFIIPDTARYYLIRGSFEDFENAKKYFYQLKGEGYEPFHLGKHGSFFLVGINIYDNPIEAYGQQYNYLDRYPESGVWIFIPEK